MGYEIGNVIFYSKPMEILRVPHSTRSSVLIYLFPKVFLIQRIFIFKDLIKINSIKDKLLKICSEKVESAFTAVCYHSFATKRD